MFRPIAASTLFALALPAAAQTAAVAPPAPKPEKKICRFYDTTGSIMGQTRVCHTKAEWASIDDANSRAASSASDPRGRYGGGGTRMGGTN